MNTLMTFAAGMLLTVACAPERSCDDTYELVEGGGISDKRHGYCKPIDTTGDTDTTTTTGETETGTTHTGTTTETTGPDPFCGDGIVNQDSEECDNGDANDDNAACTSECKQAKCGDGLTHEGVEECDDGPNNSDTAACKDDCTLNTCGDGLVHDGVEDCDDGANNADNAPCTSECKNAICGDGLVHEGVEECDDGDNNSNTAACTEACKIAICGDGLVQEGQEQCDQGEDTDECYGCNFLRTVFISSNTHKGDLGGLEGADQKCQARATAASLPGTYKAWLSDSTTSAATRLNLQNFTGDLRLTDKTVVAEGWAGLISGTLLHAINLDEKGEKKEDENVWTHTKPDGTAKGGDAHCEDWTNGSSQAQGHTGLSSMTTPQWTDRTNQDCNDSRHLYCIQTTP